MYKAAKSVNIGLKAALWQYISTIRVENSTNNKIKVNLGFNQRSNSLTMTVVTPEDLTQYRDIRLPSQLVGVVPLVAGKNPWEQSFKALTGEPLHGRCVLGEGFIQTYGRRSYSYQLDQCNHLVTSDCSGHSHAVLAREEGQGGGAG